jgi:hypothetical protein
MRFIWFSVFILGVAVIAISGQGCGGSSTDTSTPVMCGNSDACAAADPACSRGCGRGQSMLCQCGTGQLAGTLVCGPCIGDGATGGQNGGGTGGNDGTGGMAGRGGRGRGGMTGTAGRAGRGMAGAQGAAGRMGGRGTGGVTGTGGAMPSDGAIAECPADAPAGGVACMANMTAICQTACVGSMFNICTCSGGEWLCPATQIPCP